VSIRVFRGPLCQSARVIGDGFGHVKSRIFAAHIVRADFAFRDGAGNLRLNLQRDIFGFAGCFVDDDKVTAIVATELLVGVQKLDAIDRTIWRNVHVE
jgi:hypothetical protein